MTAPSNSAASSVAQILRDRALAEQVEVNPILRAALDASLKVEITGPQGEPVYAQGDFRSGKQFRPCWMVMVDQWPSGTMSLSKFIETEVRVGGICSGKNLKMMSCRAFNGRIIVRGTFGSPARLCWCAFKLNGLPSDSLERLEATLEQNRANANGEADDEIEVNVLGFHEILCELAEIHPTATVTDLSLMFVEQFDKCIIERAKRCQKYLKVSNNRHLSIATMSPKIASKLAVALVDNVLMAQLETNQDILVELQASLRVKVTSAAGDTIYAQFTFQDECQAEFGEMIPLACKSYNVEVIALSDLNKLEVKVGDITAYACPSANALRRMNKFYKQKLILYVGQDRGFCSVVLQLQGLPGYSLDLLEAAMNHNSEVDYGADSHDIIEILINLGDEHPDARALPLGIIFMKSDMQPMIERANSFARIGW